MNHKHYAQQLYDAEQNRVQIEQLTAREPQMTVEDAYQVQLENAKRRVEAGEKIIGMKIGLTSKAMQGLLGVDEPDYGHLFDYMMLLEGEPCRCSELIQPKVEGELAFCLAKPIKGPGLTVADIYNATAWVAPSIEIVDSRIQDWKVKLQDTVADNGSSARLVLGACMKPPAEIDMRLVGMTLEKNGEHVNSGTGIEVLGNPAASVAWLANKLAQYDIGLEAGHILLSGAVTAAQPAAPGDAFTVRFTGMGSVGVKFI